jgi:L-aspartate oxidase
LNHQCDVLIIGSGLSGLLTALNIHPQYKVILLAKETFMNSNSMLAQGGIAVELNKDPILHQGHFDDTLKAGAFLNNQNAVKVLVENGNDAIKKLIELGVDFDKDADHNILFTKEGGHSTRRIIHAGGDASGYHATKTLVEEVLERKNIQIFEHSMAIDLIHFDHKIRGAITLNIHHEIDYIFAKKTVLATGGIGSVYGATTNDLSATGDGIGLAYRVGAKISHMEFVQFHPTAFYDEESKSRKRFLISEAVRGEGAKLLNVQKLRFMQKYHPEKMELAPRDIVSQAIYREMYDTWTDHVYLDTRELDTKYLEKRFPTIFKHLKEHGIIMGLDLIPVAPCEHFICGGVDTDIHGKTSIDDLYAVGEVANTGVHGANRLASNSLLECVVFGLEIAKDINNTIDDIQVESCKEVSFPPAAEFNYKPIRKKIGDYMDEYVGIVRNTDGLKRALEVLTKIYEDLLKYPNTSKYYYETLNLATTAKIITEQALARKESIGCHLRIK